MGSAARNLMKFFRSTPDAGPAPNTQERQTRRSSALAELSKVFTSDDPLCVLDIGATSATNIRMFTERGHRIYSEDLLEASTDSDLRVTDDQGMPALDSKKFLDEVKAGRRFFVFNLSQRVRDVEQALKPGAN